MRRTRALASLLRWLGPWTRDSRAPDATHRERWTIRAATAERKALDATVFRGEGKALGMLVVSPGLHFDGPNDHRMDRFCSIVANAGFVVVAPFVPDYLDLLVDARAAEDVELTIRESAKRFHDLGRPTVFSISFGSYPALAAASRLSEIIDGVIVFGGYADFTAVARFCVDGTMHDGTVHVEVAFDRSNLPALFLNLARYLVPPAEIAGLEEAYRTMCRRSWGSPRRSDQAFLDELVDTIAPTLPEASRAVFRIGCGADPGAKSLVDKALAAGKNDYARFDPRSASTDIECPVVIVHGKDDDVIPWSEAVELERALSPRTATRLYLTGLFSHTGHGGIHPILAAREATSLLRMVRTLANVGRLREIVR